MRFLFNLFNHNSLGQRSLEDVIGIMGHQLRALGHEAVWDPKNEKFLAGYEGVNIIVEGFTDLSIELVRKAHAQGARFLILATEEPTDKGFNHGTQREMIFRQETFPHAAKLSEGILHLVPGKIVTDWYSQHAPAAQAELGYAPTLMRKYNKVPKWDFGFYGSMTPRRERLLKRLARQLHPCKIHVVGDFKTQSDRDEKMADCHVILQVRKFEEMGLVSSSRCNTALMLGRPVVAEAHDMTLSKPWDEIVRFTQSESHFVATAALIRRMWQNEFRIQFEQFKLKLSPQICVGEPLERIGLLPERRLPEVRIAPKTPEAEAGALSNGPASGSSAVHLCDKPDDQVPVADQHGVTDESGRLDDELVRNAGDTDRGDCGNGPNHQYGGNREASGRPEAL
jgi:hypothetical protein